MVTPTKSQAQSQPNRCDICAKPANQKCGQCQAIFYCSLEHQKEGWKTHRPICIAWKALNKGANFDEKNALMEECLAYKEMVDLIQHFDPSAVDKYIRETVKRIDSLTKAKEEYSALIAGLGALKALRRNQDQESQDNLTFFQVSYGKIIIAMQDILDQLQKTHLGLLYKKALLEKEAAQSQAK